MTGVADLAALTDAQVVALLFAFDPHGFGGVAVRGRPGPGRDAFIGSLRALLPPDTPWRRLPAGAGDARLDGELDLAATLAAGRPLRHPGLLVQSHGGVLVVPMAERLGPALAARLGTALDTGVASDGSHPARFGLLALDEGVDDETLPPALADRLAFQVEPDLDGIEAMFPVSRDALAEARHRFSRVTLDDTLRDAIGATAAACGVDSVRPAMAALRGARALAALAGLETVAPEHATLAARLVLAHRATRVPAAPDEAQQRAEPSGPETPSDPSPTADGQAARDPVEVAVQAAVRAALPAGLLALGEPGRPGERVPGRSGALRGSTGRGRPTGARPGVPHAGERLNLIDTLRAAAPWQGLRRTGGRAQTRDRVIEIRRDDLRLTRFKHRTETVTLFAVDASGSLAMQRLQEAKGAVEMLLAECYVRRDQVALLAFRGTGAELLLPPTRSLARAKRCLADLAGGGATPLATALDAALALADGIHRRGRTPTVVVLTDGRANITRDGVVDRPRAEADARDAARALALARLRTLLIDAAPRPQASARALAEAMSATYVPLPRAEAAGLMRAVRQAAPG
jgi:magnesium chelatase subunit D